VATSVLVAQPRGKEAVATAQLHAQSGSASLGAGRSATVTVNPGRHGLVSVAVALGPGVTPIAVTATASLPSQQLGPIAMKLSLTGADTYQASAVNLPAAGHWQFSLVVATSQFDATTTTV
ncbi:MAG: hypothetical protein M3O32_19795, partial [Actinomycetota bacterium]|nr:hypothetical protein [Actinomycetota bacterium]